MSLFALTFFQVEATIVDGVRQKPEVQTSGFVTDVEAYLFNVGAQGYYCQGNAWGTQASIGETGILVKFTVVSGKNGVYLLNDYFKDVNGNQQYYWKNAFFDSVTQIYVDRANQSDYYWEVEDNGDGTFRLMPSAENTQISNDIYPGMYVGLNVAENANNTALSPLLLPGTGHYIDWVLVTQAALDAVQGDLDIYNKAQELKALIDKIEAQNGDASSAKAVYLDESSTIAQLEAAIEAAQIAYVQALIDNATDKTNVDVTTLLVNPDFEKDEAGWTVVAASGSGANGRQGSVRPGGTSINRCYEAWNNSSFDIYQVVSNAPVGVYEIEVQGFYRYGRGATAWNAYLAQNVDYVKPEGVPVYVYMNNNATNFVNVYGDPRQITDASFYSGTEYATHTNGGTTYYYPNDMASGAIAFSNGMYKQSAFGLVAQEGDLLRLGVKGNSNQLNDSWVIWDNFRLIYRGFKAEVIQPVLETAVNEIKVYENMPMGKTQYAAMTKALSDASKAISDNDGEAMFAALNDLYNVKSAVQASKDLFAEKEVSASIASLSDAISEVGERKLSKTTFDNANALLTALRSNSLYEDANVNAIADDVKAQILALDKSLDLYSVLNTAISMLNDKINAKASAAVLSSANDILSSARTGYNEGSIEDENVNAKIGELGEATEAVEASEALYSNLNTAIQDLQDAVDEASAETAHVSVSLLDIANAQLTSAKKGYNEGSIADEKIEARISSINGIIENLTKSLNLYKSLNSAINELKEVLDAAAGKKYNSTVKSNAEELWTTATSAYENGSYTDDQVNAAISDISVMKTMVNNSVSQYQDLADALETLESVKDKKANQSVTDEANALYTETLSSYTDGTIADADIPAKVEEINDAVSAMNSSAEKYALLNTAIQNLEEAINEVSGETAHVSQSMLDIANAQLVSAKNGYAAGSIADDKVEGRITSINNIITNLTKSVNLYKDFATAIEALKEKIEAVGEQKLSATTLSNANSLYASSNEAYENGTLADDAVNGKIEELNAMVQSLDNSVEGYAQLAVSISNLELCIQQTSDANSLSQTKVSQSLLNEAADLLASSQNGYAAGSIEDSQVNTVKSDIADIIAQLNEAVEVAQLTITIGETGFATFFSAQPVSFAGTNLKAYTAQFNSVYSYVVTDEVTEIPANTPVIVEGLAGTHLLNLSVAPVEPENNDLVIVENGVSYGSLYVLANKSLGVGFYKWTGDEVPVGKVALNIPAGTREFIGIGFGETTGIASADRQHKLGSAIYDLQGRKVEKDVKKGLFIVDGKKRVIK